MKRIVFYIFIVVLLIIGVPAIIINISKPSVVKEKEKEKEKQIKYTKKIKVYLHEKDKVEEMDVEEYLKGVVSAEMPAVFENEALKAQAVAARTYTLYKIINPAKDSKYFKKGADISTDPTECQAWKDEEQLKKNWGLLAYDKYWNKISKAVEDTAGEVAIYDGQLINPLFHSTSGGKTENSEEVFASKLPYLRSVDSPGEEVSPRFHGSESVSYEEFRKKLLKHYPDIKIKKDDLKNIKYIELSEGGRVKTIKIGNKILSGRDLRSIFNLNSTNFKIQLNKNNIVFITTGYGHGVGMSQFGANYMAEQGKNYKEILKHYYQGIGFKNISDF